MELSFCRGYQYLGKIVGNFIPNIKNLKKYYLFPK